jgi:hypothetical protein
VVEAAAGAMEHIIIKISYTSPRKITMHKTGRSPLKKINKIKNEIKDTTLHQTT